MDFIHSPFKLFTCWGICLLFTLTCTCFCVCFCFLIYLFIFLAVLGLRFCARAFSSCSKRGPLFIAVHGPLTVVASLVAEHRLQTRRLSSCGSRAQLLHGMWDPPRPGLEPVSPALAGRFSTTAPPGKPPCTCFMLQVQPLRCPHTSCPNSWIYTACSTLHANSE